MYDVPPITPSATQASASFITGLNAQAGLTVNVQLTVREPAPPLDLPAVDGEHESGVM